MFFQFYTFFPCILSIWRWYLQRMYTCIEDGRLAFPGRTGPGLGGRHGARWLHSGENSIFAILHRLVSFH